MQREISLKTIESLESDLKAIEKLQFQVENAAKRFIISMVETNREFCKNGVYSIGYKKIYDIINKRTTLFKRSKIVDFSALYDSDLIKDIINESVGTEKLKNITVKAVILEKLLLKAASKRNAMREIIEEYICYEYTEELLDAIESLSLKNEVSIKIVHERIENLKEKIESEEAVA